MGSEQQFSGTFNHSQLIKVNVMHLLTWASLLPLALAAPVIEPRAAQVIPGNYVVKLKNGASENALQNTLRHVKVENYKHVYRSGSFKGFAAKLSPKVLDFMRKLPEVCLSLCLGNGPMSTDRYSRWSTSNRMPLSLSTVSLPKLTAPGVWDGSLTVRQA